MKEGKRNDFRGVEAHDRDFCSPSEWIGLMDNRKCAPDG